MTSLGVWASLVLLVFAIALWLQAISRMDRNQLKRDDVAMDRATKCLAARMASDAWWFSEDDKTMTAMQLYAEALQRGQVRVEGVREDWRMKMGLYRVE